MADPITRILARWVGGVQAHPVLTLLAAATLTVLAGLATLRLGVDTATTEMISPEVPFRQDLIAYRAAFPEFRSQLLVVVDAGPDAAPGGSVDLDDAAARLEAALGGRPDLFLSVYRPNAEPFWKRNGLLYLDTAALSALVDRVAQGQGLLGALAGDPTLRGLATVLADAFDAAREGLADLGGLAPLVDRIAATVEAEAAGTPAALAWRELIAGSGDALGGRRFLTVQPVLHPDRFAPAEDAIAGIRDAALTLGFNRPGAPRLRITGGPALDQENLESVSQGAGLAGVLSFLLVAAVLVLGLRSGRLILAVLVTLALGLVWTAGFAAVAVGRLNLISVAFAVLFVGLAVDFGVHFALRYREELRHGRAGLRAAAIAVGPSLLLGGFCDAIGFFAFVPTDYQGLGELGIISGASMFIALLATFTVTPAILTLLPLRSGAGPVHARFLPWLVTRAGRPVLAVAAVLAAGAVALLPFVRFDANTLSLQDQNSEAVQTFYDLARDPLTTPFRVDVLAPDLEAADALAERLDALDLVDRALTLSDFVPPDQDARLELVDTLALFLTPVLTASPPAAPADAAETGAALDRLRAALAAYAARPDARDVPGDPALGAAAARLEAALDRLPPGADPAPLDQALTGTLPALLDDLRQAMGVAPVALGDLPPALVSRWVVADGRTRVEVYPAIDVTGDVEMRRFVDEVRSVAPHATGTPIILELAGREVVKAFLQATAITLALVTLVLVAVQRRLGDVLLTLSPLVLAALLTLATSAVIGEPLNFANVIVLPLLFALGVSSSIYLVMELRAARAEGQGIEAVLRTSTPLSVLLSALTTIDSFGTLMISDNGGMASMGLMLAIAIAWVLVCSLLVLPSLLHVFPGLVRGPAPAWGTPP